MSRRFASNPVSRARLLRALPACLVLLAGWTRGGTVPVESPPGDAVEDRSWLRRWETHLDRDVLPYWTARPREQDSLVFRLRALDVCAIAITREPDAARRRRLRADLEAGLAEARRLFHDPETGDWRSSAKAAEDSGKTRTTADQSWAAIVLADIHLRVDHPEALRLARSTLARIDASAHDDEHGGYFLSYPMDRYERIRHEPSRKHAPTQLHVLLALTRLLLADPRDELVRSRLEELYRLVPRFVSPETGHVRWALARNWTPAEFERPINNQTLYGQNAEAITYLLAAADALGRPREELLPLLENIARALIRDGIDPEGAVYYLGPMDGPAFDRRVWWWPQIETAAALWRMHEASGDEHYREAFDRVSAWAFARFIPSSGASRGRWHTLLSPEGEPLPLPGAAHENQTGYHVARCILGMLSPSKEQSGCPSPWVLSSK